MDDADIHSDDSIKKYKQYWFDKCQTILKDPTMLANGNYDDYVKIYRFIDTFIDQLKDEVYLDVAYADICNKASGTEPAMLDIVDGKKQGFDQFLNKVFTKMEEQ
jgi:hypothetical protein